jgi:hypothetical protein
MSTDWVLHHKSSRNLQVYRKLGFYGHGEHLKSRHLPPADPGTGVNVLNEAKYRKIDQAAVLTRKFGPTKGHGPDRRGVT